jgi:cell filamentation protein
MKKQRIIWRWAERDYGYRFRASAGKRSAEHYQAANPGEFYVVPSNQRKLTKETIEELSKLAPVLTAPNIVASPWRDYGNTDLQQITTHEGSTCLNLAGCLHPEEIKLRETNGVNRAKAFVADLATRDEPVPITLELIQRIHKEMFADIYPWAGAWRTVFLHKGEGPIRWPLPPFGMEPVMEEFGRDVLSKTPFISNDDDAVLGFVARLLGDYLALHPFREGNGRSAFILSELVLLQNGLVPLDEYNRKRDESRYFAACDAARLCDYVPLTALVTEWETQRQEALQKRLEGGN